MRVRPVTMTAMAAFFAMVPGAFALERGSEANAPLARAILGGLLAFKPSTLFVLPCPYSLLVPHRPYVEPKGVSTTAALGSEPEPSQDWDNGWE